MYYVEVTMKDTKEPVVYQYRWRWRALRHVSIELLHGHVCVVYYEKNLLD